MYHHVIVVACACVMFLLFFNNQKLIKDLPTFGDAARSREAALDSESSSVDESTSSTRHQRGGDATMEKSSVKRPREELQLLLQRPASPQDSTTPSLGQCPGEVAFFKFLHAELKKAEFFFEETTKEFQIREQRVRKGMEVIKGQERSMVDDKWRTMSRAMYLLYKDLLLLETFAIMTYVGFSKILKKHDKVTGYRTCTAYMESIVNNANFTHYPHVMTLISRSQLLYEEISEVLEHEGKKALSEDEQLFISMIQRVNEEVLGGEDTKNDAQQRPTIDVEPAVKESKAVGDLRELLAADSVVDTQQGNDPCENCPVKKRTRRMKQL